ncbi:MAG: ABC transporter ATP-binding protein [Akkermansia sp.]|nr:ABC transporter ATP-binding protein [Akkermansia sp.]
MITATNLHRSYTIGKKSIEILHGVNLHIAEGEKVFLCGPSGAGKTTLMYTLAGLETPQAGTVHIAGTELYALSATKRAEFRNQHMGFIFQNYLLMPELTALENACLASAIGKKAHMEDVKRLLDKVGLGHRLHHLPSELSGGEQQRVAIARALANNAPIIFADEPTGNLDRKNGTEVLDLLFELADEGPKKKTLVIVTHDEHIAQRGDRIITIMDGQAM